MIVYKKEWLDNLAILKAARLWTKQDLLSAEEYEEVSKKYPSGYRQSGIFTRIGLFIFTLIILGSAFGFYGLALVEASGRNGIMASCIVFGLICYGMAEYFVKNDKYVGSGILAALIYTAIGFVSCGIIFLLPDDVTNKEPLSVFLILFPLLAFVALRFADWFLTLTAFICFLIINALILLKMGTAGKMILPFESMGISYLFYHITLKLKANNELRFWNNCLVALEIASLATLYLSGNYMMIRVLTESLLDTTIEAGNDISLAPFFYAYSILVPIVYIGLGLKRKNYVFMRLGLVLLAAGILSIKYYHSFMPPETALTLAGIAMILVAYFSIKYFKTPKHGITMEANEQSSKHKAMANIAGIAISQVMSNQPQPTKSSETQFGGGDFGGGGAGADF